MNNFECIIDAHAQLGECPRWDDIGQFLYWVDILAPAIHRFDPLTGQQNMISMPEDIGCLSLADDGGFIAGMRSGIWRLNAAGQQIEMLAANPEMQTSSRFNDGRCDKQGRFWAGTIDEPKQGGHAHLYRYDDRGLVDMGGGLLTSNGLAFSPDQRWLYHADTPNFTIYRYAYDAVLGTLGSREVWVRLIPTAEDRGRPDGAAVDSEGYYWSALYEGGRVVRISPDGNIVEEFQLPVRCPTMCAFGGRDLRTLYVTSTSSGRSAEELQRFPQSGGVFAMRVEVPGLPEPRFRTAASL